MIPRKENRLEEKVALIKSMVTNTLENLDDVETQIDTLQKKKATLKRDLNDLKEGRLDRIEERQKIDQQNSIFSAFLIEKKIVVAGNDVSHWYIPYLVTLRLSKHNVRCDELDINNSITKINAPGSYKLANGKVTYL